MRDRVRFRVRVAFWFRLMRFYLFCPLIRMPLIDQFSNVLNGLDTSDWDSVSDDAKEVVLIGPPTVFNLSLNPGPIAHQVLTLTIFILSLTLAQQ